MADKPLTRAQRRALAKKKQRRRRLLIGGGALGAALLIALALLLLLRRPAPDGAIPSALPPAQTDAPAAQADATPSPSPEPTPEPTPSPTPSPEPTPTIVPGSIPNVVSFYTPQGKNYSPRVRMGDTYTGPWKKGKDIGSFEAIPSDEAELPGEFFGDIFGAAWTAFPDANSCKIGYTLRYTLDDGSEIKYTMLSPKHIEHTEYIECWL